MATISSLLRRGFTIQYVRKLAAASRPVSMAAKPYLSGTELIHADDKLSNGLDVAPAISMTTTFRAAGPDAPDPLDPLSRIYSRYTTDVTSRVELLLGKIAGGHAVTYSSGLASAFAALLFLHPKRLAISGGYFGFYKTIDIYKRIRGDLEIIGIDEPYQPGDVCWLETPLNPTGEARDIQYYADKVHAVGGKLAVDSTFAPPPLQDPFKWGADLVMHSATKYMGGHSDLLGGVLMVKSEKEFHQLWHDRSHCGNTLGNLEGWLLLRSLRTLHLRVPRQSETATALVAWLNNAAGGKEYDGIPAGALAEVLHSSIQKPDARGFTPDKQMAGGYNATFAILVNKPEHAVALPHVTEYFVPATSLGGVESLIEHRYTVDGVSDPRLLRISVGVEELEDLKNDIRLGLQKVMKV